MSAYLRPGFCQLSVVIQNNIQISVILLCTAFILGFLVSSVARKFSASKSEEDLLKKQVFNEHAYPIWIYNTDSLKILAANKAFCKKFSYKEKELKKMTILQLRPENQAFKVKNFMRDVKEFKIPFANSGVWVYKKRNGETFRMQVSTLFSGSNATRAVIGMDMDEVANLKEQLKQVAWMQSHVVRKPLANMMSLVELLNDPLVTDKERNQYLPLLKQCCHELDGKIKDIVRNTETESKLVKLPVAKNFMDSWKHNIKYFL